MNEMKKLKKAISYISALAIMSSTVIGQSVTANAEYLQEETAKSAAEDFVSSYYYSMYTDSCIDLYGKSAYEEMADYLSVKLKYQQQICSDVENYKVYTYTESVEESESAFLFNIYTAVEFNYLGADFDSGFSTNNQIMVEKGGECKILDVIIGWGLDDSLLERDSLDLNACYWEKNEVTEESVAEVCDYMEEAMAEEQIQAMAAADIADDTEETYSTNAFSSSVTDSQRNLMAAYAITNTRALSLEETGGIPNKYVTPVSGNPKLIETYCDFSIAAPGNFDCTNFISHCLLAGGAVMNRTENTGWYFTDMRDRTPAWSGVDYFYTFITTNKGVGPKAVLGPTVTGSTTRQLVNCSVGDIIQFDYYPNDGKYDHTVMITGIAPSGDKHWPAVSGRSAYNIKTSSNIALPECRTKQQYPDLTYRLLRLTSLT